MTGAASSTRTAAAWVMARYSSCQGKGPNRSSSSLRRWPSMTRSSASPMATRARPSPVTTIGPPSAGARPTRRSGEGADRRAGLRPSDQAMRRATPAFGRQGHTRGLAMPALEIQRNQHRGVAGNSVDPAAQRGGQRREAFIAKPGVVEIRAHGTFGASAVVRVLASSSDAAPPAPPSRGAGYPYQTSCGRRHGRPTCDE